MISTNRGECQEQILKFPGARYKKFATKELAQSFICGSDNPAEGRCCLSLAHLHVAYVVRPMLIIFSPQLSYIDYTCV